MNARESRPLALTMGEPAGIGPDITLSAWLGRKQNCLPVFAIIMDPKVLEARAKLLDVAVPLRTITQLGEAAGVFEYALPILPLEAGCAAPCCAGVADSGNAVAVINSIETAVDLVICGKAGAVVTNPINKSVLYGAGFEHPGHTEFLGALAKKHGHDAYPVMMLVAEELCVVPTTIHIPLMAVGDNLSVELIDKTVSIVAESLTRFFGIAEPRIALTGLNPHAGESGSLGKEETTIIEPAIALLQQKGLSVSGPYPADTLFHEAARASYDVVVTMYHDQGLIPIKTLAFDRGVNVTLGLPFIRTSPDHGTAFDIAGTGKANPQSLIEALKLADRMASFREGVSS